MTIRNLHYLFRPRSVAVVGASDRAGSVGSAVMRNLLDGGFPGPIYPVHRTRESVHGVHAYCDLYRLPQTPDLAVICTPADQVPEVISHAGARGTRAAVVLAQGIRTAVDSRGRALEQQMLDAARRHLLRILGPNSLGICIPGIGLNASFASTRPRTGDLALVSQSGVLTSAIVEHAATGSVGFSAVVSLGDGADVDVADVLDYLSTDADTRAILLYLESAGCARKFLSAARAAARAGPLIVLKGGRTEEGARAASLHVGAPLGDDLAFDAALRRAGALRVASVDQMLRAAETIARLEPTRIDRVAIMTNGGGPGVLATDALIGGGGRLSSLSVDTVDSLDALLPASWSRSNPVDVSGDAPAARYAAALGALLADAEVDAVVFLYGPTAVTPPEAIADACAPIVAGSGKNVVVTWMGGAGTAAAARIFSTAGVPTFQTPEAAVDALLVGARYHAAQALLSETPPSSSEDSVFDAAAVRELIRGALQAGRNELDMPAAMRLLAAYGVPAVDACVAADAEEAVRMAGQIGFPVALKVLSRDIAHRSEVSGVILDLENGGEVRQAAAQIEGRVRRLRPGARLDGFLVQRMIRARGAMGLRHGMHELRVVARVDPVFGPVVVFGRGGRTAGQAADEAAGLPPLNSTLARDVIARTAVHRILAAPAQAGGVDIAALARVLTAVAQLIADHAEVEEIVIDPLHASGHGIVALNARVRIRATSSSAEKRLAICPYPTELEEAVQIDGRQAVLRPIRPGDAEAYARFFAAIEPRDLHLRFFGAARTLSAATLARATQIDYDREMSFVVATPSGVTPAEIFAELRLVSEPLNQYAELAVLVRNDVQRKGLGRILLRKAAEYAGRRGVRELVGFVMPDNHRMLALARAAGMETHQAREDSTAILRQDLDPKRATPRVELF